MLKLLYSAVVILLGAVVILIINGRSPCALPEQSFGSDNPVRCCPGLKTVILINSESICKYPWDVQAAIGQDNAPGTSHENTE